MTTNGLNGQSLLNLLVDESLFTLDCWSVSQEEVVISNVAGDVALPDVVIANLPAGVTVVKAIAIFKARTIENTNAGANKLNGAQSIQVRNDTPSAWIDAISFVDDEFGIAANSREGGDAIVGSIDISGTVIGNDTYNFQWHDGIADLANLQFNDVQMGIRIWYRV